MNPQDDPAMPGPRTDLGHSSGAPTGAQDITALLDLHRRGVIDDAQFALLSANLTQTAAVPAGRPAGLAPSRPRSSARRRAALLTGAAVALLGAAGLGAVVLLADAEKSPVPPAALAGPTNAAAGELNCYALLQELVEKDAGRTRAQLTGDLRAAACDVTILGPAPAAQPSAKTSPSNLPRSATPSATLSTATGQDTGSASSAEDESVAAPPTRRPVLTAPPTPTKAPAPPAPATRTPAPVRPTAQADCALFALEEAENQRTREAESFNQNVEFNMALNSGDLDRAAIIQNNMRAAQERWAIEDRRLQAQYPGC